MALITGHETQLSRCEIEVLRAIAQGKSNEEIAEALLKSQGTVHKQIERIMDKLRLRRRTQLAIYALKEGLISLDEITLPEQSRG